MSTLQDIVDIAPEPTLKSTELSLAVAIAVVLLVAVTVLLWRARNKASQPGRRAVPGFIPTPVASTEASSDPSSSPTVPTAAAPPFDRVKALDLCGDDDELLRSVVLEIPAEIDSQMQIIWGALAANDTKTLHVNSHRLKGSLLLIAAEPAAAVALSIEFAARDENLADIPAKVTELDAELVRLKAAIAEYLLESA